MLPHALIECKRRGSGAWTASPPLCASLIWRMMPRHTVTARCSSCAGGACSVPMSGSATMSSHSSASPMPSQREHMGSPPMVSHLAPPRLSCGGEGAPSGHLGLQYGHLPHVLAYALVDALAQRQRGLACRVVGRVTGGHIGQRAAHLTVAIGTAARCRAGGLAPQCRTGLHPQQARVLGVVVLHRPGGRPHVGVARTAGVGLRRRSRGG